MRNSYDGVWVESIGYVFTDNGRDWEGDHPHEEINLLVEGGDYGCLMIRPKHQFLPEVYLPLQCGPSHICQRN